MSVFEAVGRNDAVHGHGDRGSVLFLVRFFFFFACVYQSLLLLLLISIVKNPLVLLCGFFRGNGRIIDALPIHSLEINNYALNFYAFTLSVPCRFLVHFSFQGFSIQHLLLNLLLDT